MDRARDFRETERTPGWEAYKSDVEEAIAQAKQELATLETDGKTTDQIGADHLRISEYIAGMIRALQVAEDIKSEPTDDL